VSLGTVIEPLVPFLRLLLFHVLLAFLQTYGSLEIMYVCIGGVYVRSTYVCMYSVILSVLDPRKCEYLKDHSLDFEHAYMTTYLAS